MSFASRPRAGSDISSTFQISEIEKTIKKQEGEVKKHVGGRVFYLAPAPKQNEKKEQLRIFFSSILFFMIIFFSDVPFFIETSWMGVYL